MTYKTVFIFPVMLPLTTMLLSSCLMAPDYHKPQIENLAQWKSSPVTSGGEDIPSAWWTIFGDDVLNRLVNDATRQNFDIQAGIERVNQSRAALKIAGANLLPSADASLSVGKTRTNPAAGNTGTITPVSGGLSIGYDLDLFGANQFAVDSKHVSLKASELSQKSLEIATTTDVAEAYFNLLMTRERIALGQDNLKNAQELLRIVSARVKAGVDSNLELSQQKVAVANNQAALTILTQSESIYINALAILLGHTPQNFTVVGSGLGKLVAPSIAIGQPSTLLERRPDIAAAEQNLISANANIGAARAAFYPSVTLGGTLSATGVGLSDPLTTALGVASSLTAPIFAGGRLEGGVEQATAVQRELLAVYHKTVLSAFGEVENALSAIQTTTAQENALKTAVTEAQKAYDISRKRYQVGTIDFATMLNTQSALIEAEDNYTQAMKSRLSASLDLIKALGGGWKMDYGQKSLDKK